MEFLIETPKHFEKEREYIISVLIGDILGLKYRISFNNQQNTSIKYSGNSARLILFDRFFQTPIQHWLKQESLPLQPLEVWQIPNDLINPTLVNSKIPIIYGSAHDFPFSISANYCQIPIDIFGSAFFMLTRYEEIVKTARDHYNRFPAYASLAYQENFLSRPIINEYIEILYFCMKKLWNRLERKRRNFCIIPTSFSINPFNLKKLRIPSNSIIKSLDDHLLFVVQKSNDEL